MTVLSLLWESLYLEKLSLYWNGAQMICPIEMGCGTYKFLDQLADRLRESGRHIECQLQRHGTVLLLHNFLLHSHQTVFTLVILKSRKTS